MAASVSQVAYPEALMEERLRAIQLPAGVRFRRVYLAPDWSGDEAAYAVFAVSDKLGAGARISKALVKLMDKATEAIEAVEPQRMAYVHFEATR